MAKAGNESRCLAMLFSINYDGVGVTIAGYLGEVVSH